VGPRTGLDDKERRKTLPLPELELRLRYPGYPKISISIKINTQFCNCNRYVSPVALFVHEKLLRRVQVVFLANRMHGSPAVTYKNT
jgi:hypothetical protein